MNEEKCVELIYEALLALMQEGLSLSADGLIYTMDRVVAMRGTRAALASGREAVVLDSGRCALGAPVMVIRSDSEELYIPVPLGGDEVATAQPVYHEYIEVIVRAKGVFDPPLGYYDTVYWLQSTAFWRNHVALFFTPDGERIEDFTYSDAYPYQTINAVKTPGSDLPARNGAVPYRTRAPEAGDASFGDDTYTTYGPRGVACAPNGDIYVIAQNQSRYRREGGRGQIVRFTAAGEFIERFDISPAHSRECEEMILIDANIEAPIVAVWSRSELSPEPVTGYYYPPAFGGVLTTMRLNRVIEMWEVLQVMALPELALTALDHDGSDFYVAGAYITDGAGNRAYKALRLNGDVISNIAWFATAAAGACHVQGNRIIVFAPSGSVYVYSTIYVFDLVTGQFLQRLTLPFGTGRVLTPNLRTYPGDPYYYYFDQIRIYRYRLANIQPNPNWSPDLPTNPLYVAQQFGELVLDAVLMDYGTWLGQSLSQTYWARASEGFISVDNDRPLSKRVLYFQERVQFIPFPESVRPVQRIAQGGSFDTNNYYGVGDNPWFGGNECNGQAYGSVAPVNPGWNRRGSFLSYLKPAVIDLPYNDLNYLLFHHVWLRHVAPNEKRVVLHYRVAIEVAYFDVQYATHYFEIPVPFDSEDVCLAYEPGTTEFIVYVSAPSTSPSALLRFRCFYDLQRIEPVAEDPLTLPEAMHIVRGVWVNGEAEEDGYMAVMDLSSRRIRHITRAGELLKQSQIVIPLAPDGELDFCPSPLPGDLSAVFCANGEVFCVDAGGALTTQMTVPPVNGLSYEAAPTEPWGLPTLEQTKITHSEVVAVFYRKLKEPDEL